MTSNLPRWFYLVSLILGFALSGCCPSSGVVGTWVICKDSSCNVHGRAGVSLSGDATFIMTDTWNSTEPNYRLCTYCFPKVEGTYYWDGTRLSGRFKGSTQASPDFSFDFPVHGDIADVVMPLKGTVEWSQFLWGESRWWLKNATEAPSMPNVPWHARRDCAPVGGCCND